MPIYTYECENCGERFEAKQSFNDAPLTVCPTCSEEKLYRVIQSVGIVFKGSGFYVTDSRGKQNLATTGPKKEDSKPSESGNGSTSGTEGTPAKAETTDKPAASTTTAETK
jgi:putative FmdB family regulatory protein